MKTIQVNEEIGGLKDIGDHEVTKSSEQQKRNSKNIIIIANVWF